MSVSPIEPTPVAASESHSHLAVTAHIPRPQGLVPATIIAVESLSPTVRRLLLELPESEAHRARFLPGQWVDFHIPGGDMVGGYSICSTPSQLRDLRQIELAVKRSTHPPAAWVHAHAAVGTAVQIEIGGEFYYDPTGVEQSAPAVFLIGGVGITPIISMVRQRMEAQANAVSQSSGAPTVVPSTTVLYSAKDADELVFSSDLKAFRDRPNYDLYLSATAASKGQHAEEWSPAEMNAGRVPLGLLRRLLERDLDTVHVFLCGPPTMVDELLPVLEQTLPKERLHYEKWW